MLNVISFQFMQWQTDIIIVNTVKHTFSMWRFEQCSVVWDINKRKRKIMNKQKWQHEHFLNAFFTNSQRPVVDCLNVAAGILARSKRVIEGTGADQRFVKNAFKNAECHP